MNRARRFRITHLAAASGLALLLGAHTGVLQAAPAKTAAKTAAKTTAKSTAKSTAKPAAKGKAKTAAKPAAKTTAKPAAKTASTRVPLPRSRPAPGASTKTASLNPAPTATPAALPTTTMPAARAPFTPSSPTALGPAQPMPTPKPVSPPMSDSDVANTKQAMALVSRGKIDDARSTMRGVNDRAAQKLVDWAILRSPYTDSVSFERYVAFINDNPNWPSLELFRRRAEGSLWEDRRDVRTVRSFFSTRAPVSPKGRLALARAYLAQGDRKAAEPLVREVWRHDSLSSTLEGMVTSTFGDMMTAADNKARMDERLYDGETEPGMRMAQRLGSTQQAIAKAWVGMIRKAGNVKALLDAVPAEGRRDPGYLFVLAQYLRRADRISEAAQAILSVPKDPAAQLNLDEWWKERRYLIRKLLDNGDAKTAYLIAREALPPPQENYRVDHQFTAGWVALRYLNDPATALTHFNKIPEGISAANPHALSRAYYWQGRALEALGRREEARQRYEAAAQHTTVYYGQIARARIGLPDLPLHPPPVPAAGARPDVVRALEFLYAIDERDLANVMLADLGERCDDLNILAGIGEAANRAHDARGMLLLGKAALGRGHPFDYYAHPTVGLPGYSPIGPAIDPSMAYSIARTESHFNQRVVSTAKAVGLMQVTPDAGKYIARKFKAIFDWARMQKDPVYNTQFGTAELGDLMQFYNGSYILTFAGYNAGRGRVKEWMARFGDPRDPKVDPIDWVERIPFSETRNYVPRILEAMQVYRIRFGANNKLMIEADLHRGSRIQ